VSAAPWKGGVPSSILGFHTMICFLKLFGVYSNMKINREQVLELRETGLTYQQIADKLNCVKSTVAYHCSEQIRIKHQVRMKKCLVNRYDVCSCGKRKMAVAETCQRWSQLERFMVSSNRTIADVTCNYIGGGPYNTVRRNARVAMKFYGGKAACKVCGFDVHVQVCHIKSIPRFPKDTPLKVVNSIDNLVYLCPNHHWMFDHGMININE